MTTAAGDRDAAEFAPGVRFRFSDEVGATIGRDVADYGLQRLGAR